MTIPGDFNQYLTKNKVMSSLRTEDRKALVKPFNLKRNAVNTTSLTLIAQQHKPDEGLEDDL